MEARISHDRRWQTASLLFLLVSTLWRLSRLSALELVPDEAYYWDWSRRLDWGYYDQGPLIAYVIRLTTTLFGTNEFGVRFGVFLASFGTLFCCYLLARRLYSPLAGFLTLVLLGVTPLMEVGSLIATYDPLLVFFWALTVLLLAQALGVTGQGAEKQSPSPTPVRGIGLWLLIGLSAGLGFLSKHTMVLILPCLVLFLALSPLHRRWLLRPEPYAAFLVMVLLYSGVIWWNVHHHWWTFQHLLFLAAKSSGSPLKQLGDFVGSQALLLGPGLFLGILTVCWQRQTGPYAKSQSREEKKSGQSSVVGDQKDRAEGTPSSSGRTLSDAVAPETGRLSPRPEDRAEGTSESRPQDDQPKVSGATALATGSGETGTSVPGLSVRQPAPLFLVCMGLPVFLFFCLMTLKAKAQGNWAPCAWLSTTVLFAGWLAARMEEPLLRKRMIGLTALVAGLSLFLSAVMVSPDLRHVLHVKLPPEADLSNTAYGWKEVAQRIQQSRQEMGAGGKNVFLVGSGYQYCALLAFYLPDHPETQDLFLHYRLTMYAAHVESLKNRIGQDALFINENQVEDGDLRQLFEQVEWEPTLEIWRRPYYTEPIRKLYIARCRNFRRYVGLEWAVGG